MRNFLSILFGAHAQVIAGLFFLVLTIIQSWYWGIHLKPNATAIFWVSMEALAFASYGVVATGLGFRATERVETAIIENIENADEVNLTEKGA